MLSTPHLFVGAAVGSATGHPALAVLAGLLSHHLLDGLPHWDPGSFYTETSAPDTLRGRDLHIALLDNLLAPLCLGWFVIRWPALDWRLLLAGSVGALLPDLWHHFPLWSRRTRRGRWYDWHRRWHRTLPHRNFWWGMLTQALVMLAAWWGLTYLSVQ